MAMWLRVIFGDFIPSGKEGPSVPTFTSTVWADKVILNLNVDSARDSVKSCHEIHSRDVHMALEIPLPPRTHELTFASSLFFE